MVTLNTILFVGVILGILNMCMFILILRKLNKIERDVKLANSKLEENDGNMKKVVDILNILLKRTKSRPINLN